MDKMLGKYSDRIHAVLRIVAGFLFLQHGVQKVFGGLGADQARDLMTRAGVAGMIELVGGALIMVGLFTGWAAFISSGQMAVAYFLVHAPQGFWPVMNRGELAALYCFLFLYLAARGDGAFSVGRLLEKRA